MDAVLQRATPVRKERAVRSHDEACDDQEEGRRGERPYQPDGGGKSVFRCSRGLPCLVFIAHIVLEYEPFTRNERQ
jgi:hypothetical protein